MPREGSRRFSRDFKLSAVLRMADCGNVSALARELGVRRKLLYAWREAYLSAGAGALRGPGRPRRGSVVVGVPAGAGAVAPGPGGALALARSRIAELERKVGQQALEADFLKQALQRIEASRQAKSGPGETVSSTLSRPGHSGKAEQKRC